VLLVPDMILARPKDGPPPEALCNPERGVEELRLDGDWLLSPGSEEIAGWTCAGRTSLCCSQDLIAAAALFLPSACQGAYPNLAEGMTWLPQRCK
jgi:hypothetical protein